MSSDEIEETFPWAARKGIAYDLASDPSGAAIRAWGLQEEGETRSVPATFVVDRGGVIRFRQIGRSVTDRVEIDDLLAALRAP